MVLVFNPDHPFTLREQQILYFAAQGLSNKEIADHLVVSEQTVKTHLSHMLTKSLRANRTSLVVYGFESGILQKR